MQNFEQVEQENFSPVEAVIAESDAEAFAPPDAKTPLEKAIADAPVYDSTVNQRIPVTVTEDGEEFTDVHVIRSLTSPEGEAALIAFDTARQAIIRSSEGKNRFKSRSSKAAIELYDALAVAVRENDEDTELPKDWKAQIAEEDKIAVVNHILAVSIIKNEAVGGSGGEKGSRLFGRAKAGRILTLECYFNDEIVQTTHRLRRKTAEDYEKYEEITGFSFDENKGLAKADTDIVADSNWAEKSELYRSLIEDATGYVGDVPLHHRAAIVDAYFRPSSATQKKSNRSPKK